MSYRRLQTEAKKNCMSLGLAFNLMVFHQEKLHAPKKSIDRKVLLKASHGSIILEVGTGGDIVLTDQAVNKPISVPILCSHKRFIDK